MQSRISKRPTKTIADERHVASRADALTLLPVWPCDAQDRSLSGRRTLVAIIERELRKERRLGIAGNRAYDIARHARLALLLKQEREGLVLLQRTK